MRITRRTLVRRSAAIGLGLALAQPPAAALLHSARAAAASPKADTEGQRADRQKAILYDLTRCAGCHFCQVACQANKGLPPDISLISFRSAGLSRNTGQAWAVRRHQCMHCLHPACVSACPVGAMEKLEHGPVVYHDERCLGCRYCMNACPFGVPAFDWYYGILDGALIRKCDFCYDRQAEGRPPACIEACPTKAVTFGDREELLAKARELVRQHPDRYVDHIYGEAEAGGTSFLIIAGVPFEQLGLPQPGSEPLPELSEKVMSGVIPFALGWTAVLSGIAALTRRREQARQGKPPAGNDEAGRKEVDGQ